VKTFVISVVKVLVAFGYLLIFLWLKNACGKEIP